MQIIPQIILVEPDRADGFDGLRYRSATKNHLTKDRLLSEVFCYSCGMAHTFKVGQRVTMDRSKIFSSAPGTYVVVAALPESGGRLQYRIKSELEKYERVAEQAALHPMLEEA